MGRKLTAREISALKDSGRHSIGDSLYLVVDGDARRWVFRYQVDGKRREMGLGSAHNISLKVAREKVDDAKRQIREGIDPVDARLSNTITKVQVPTFGEFASKLVDDIEFGFRNAKHRQQWRNTLATYCAPMDGKPVDEINTTDVLECLSPIWQTKSETASRVRGRIERVLDAAKAKGLRSGENPALWRGHIDALLPKRHRLTRGHHEAMPFSDLPKFIATLRQREALAALALEFTILTAARSGEVLGAAWDEIDLDARVWTVPAHRMKAGQAHRVPLSSRSLEILESAAKVRVSDYVFPGQSKERPLSGMSMEMLLRRMGITSATVHGFRSSFRDWAGETTNFARELIEASMSHQVGNAVERAYRRGDALERRRPLLDAWCDYCEGTKTAQSPGSLGVV